MNDNVSNTRKQQFYAICGIIAPIIFWIMVIVESILRPGYSQYYNFVSDLGVGHLAILQNINFIVFGILTIIFALGLRNGLPTPQGRSLKAGVWFVILFALGVLLAGVFPESFLSANPHNIVSATAFVAIIAAQLLIWQGLKNRDKTVWGRYATYSFISGLLSLILVIFLKVAILYGFYPGLSQRVFLIVSWAWIGITGIKLYRLTHK
ncbi:MAG: DUF998 domain-containing protein [Methanobacterium sp.]|uniref:DUF998 domain-containing protein n=1 Tax=Methanobacterium sp. TaxID=2164 RepID=UPI003C746935